jgi:glycosyltransferase involved in cell wall biosynthesis
MRILITVPIFANGGGITRYILSLCRIFSPEHRICLIETHNKVKSKEIEREIKSINPSIKYIVTGNKTKISNYLYNIYYSVRFNPDIIISNFNGQTQLLLPIIKRNAKVIHIIHNAASEFYNTARINARFVDKWIAPTKGIQTLYNKYTNNRYSERVEVLHHGVGNAICSANKNKAPLEICFVGVVDQHKGILVIPEIIKNYYGMELI